LLIAGPSVAPPRAHATTGTCVGDCNGNAAVEVADLVLAVGAATIPLPADMCPGLDIDHDDAIEVNELVLAVRNALTQCKVSACGDGILDPGEECDDGGCLGGDGCSEDCLFEQATVTDQEWMGFEEGCGGSTGRVNVTSVGPLGQEFVPVRSRLRGVSVVAAIDGREDVEQSTITLRLREGTIDGEVVGERSQTVATTDDEDRVRFSFDFLPSLVVTPGAIYVIELSSPDRRFLWYDSRGSDTCTNVQYPRGRPITLGMVVGPEVEEADFLFSTSAPGLPDGCANGFLDGDEECDDGNRADDDGCSAACVLEEPSVVDQSWLGFPPGCGGSGGQTNVLLLAPLGQEFVPERSRLRALDVGLWVDPNAPRDTRVLARIRAEAVLGPIVGESERIVTPASRGVPDLERFEFSPAVAVIPGASYVIELVSFNGSVLWESSRGNPECPVVEYPAGRPIRIGMLPEREAGAQDFLFRTYAPAE
jgi:cysteine-rich repeat protein